MHKKLIALVLCLVLVAGMIPTAGAYDREFQGESVQSVDQCNHTRRVNTADVNYVRPNFDGFLIEVTPQRVEDTFAYLDELYVQKYPEAALTVYTGTEQDRADILKLALEITEGCDTNREKANAIDAWLQKNVVYVLNSSAYASDTMYRLEGNCLSYANLMQFLLRSLGIPAVVGDGWRGDMKTNTVDLFNYDGHAWCFALLDGEWVLYDPLWLSGGTTDREYMAEWIYFDTVEFVCPASDGDHLPPEAYDKPKAYYTDGKVYAWSDFYQDSLGVLTSFVNNQAYCFVTNQCDPEGSQDGWYVLDQGCDKDSMELGQVYNNCWMSYGDYNANQALCLTYAFPNGMMADGYIMTYEGVDRMMYCNTSWPILADQADYTITDGTFTLKPGYSGVFLDYPWQNGWMYEEDEYVVVWENRSEEVATVDQNGIITCHAEGFADFMTYVARVETDGSLSYMSTSIIQVVVSSEERTRPSGTDSSGKEPASGTCGENAAWTLGADGTLTISGTGEMYNYGFDEAPWYGYHDQIAAVVVSDGITWIGENAFYGMENLVSADISDSVTGIGNFAFFGDGNLATMELPAQLTSLGQQAFANCASLTAVDIPGTVSFLDASVFENCTSLTDVCFLDSNVEAFIIGNSPFRGCTALEEIRVDNHPNLTAIDGVLYIRDGYGYILQQYPAGSQRTSYAVPEGTYMIGQMALNGAAGLEKVTIPASVESIGNFAFWSCSNLHTVYFEGDAPELYDAVFYDVTATVYYPAGNATWTEAVMQDYMGSLTWVPYAVEDEYSGVCGDDLTWELSEDGILTISGTGAMYDYAAAVEPAAITVMAAQNQAPWYAVRSEIRRIVLGEAVTSIGDYAFADCGAVETVTIPAAVEKIGQSAFSDCTGLTEIVFEGDAPEIGDSAFESVEAQVTYPENNDTWNDEVIGNYGGELTWPEMEEKEEYTIKWISGTTSLNGTIDLNIYVALSENLLDEEDAFVRFTHSGVTVDVPVSKGLKSEKNGTVCYRYSCEIFAKQVADTVTVQVMDENGQIGKTLNYSVMQYCVNQINKSTDQKLVAVCKTLLNYAAAAQTYFNYNTENLANASLSEEDKALFDVDASSYAYDISGKEPGIRASSATLMLESEVKIRVYFQLTGDKTIEDYTFTIDGKEVEVQQNDKGYYIESDGIPAKELDDMHKFCVGGITVNYGALSYVNSKVTSSKTAENERNLAKALYAYYAAAEALLG